MRQVIAHDHFFQKEPGKEWLRKERDPVLDYLLQKSEPGKLGSLPQGIELKSTIVVAEMEGFSYQ